MCLCLIKLTNQTSLTTSWWTPTASPKMHIATIFPSHSAAPLAPSGGLVQPWLHWPYLIWLNSSTPPISLMPAPPDGGEGGCSWPTGAPCESQGNGGRTCRQHTWGRGRMQECAMEMATGGDRRSFFVSLLGKKGWRRGHGKILLLLSLFNQAWEGRHNQRKDLL